MAKQLAAALGAASMLALSPASAAIGEGGTATGKKTEILLAGDTSCREVVRFVCRWEDGQKYCDRAVDWICG